MNADDSRILPYSIYAYPITVIKIAETEQPHQAELEDL